MSLGLLFPRRVGIPCLSIVIPMNLTEVHVHGLHDRAAW